MAAVVAGAVSISARGGEVLVDPQAEKRWLVEKLSASPRLASFLARRLDHRTAGGLLLTTALVVVLALSVFSGLVFDMVDQGFGLATYDSAVAEFGAEQAGAAAEEIAQVMTLFGGTEIVIIASLVIAAWGWWRYNSLQIALFMLVVVAGQALVTSGIKWIVGRDRPDIAQLAPYSGSSFPSGHSAAAAATYMAIALVLTLGRGTVARSAAAAGAALIAGSVAATRALLGVHWLTDVLAGTAIGLAWFIASAVAFGGSLMRFGEPIEEVAPSRSTGEQG